MQSINFTKRLAPGVYQYKESSGLVKVSVDRLLADGSLLSSPENAHLFSTIDTITMEEYPSASTTTGQLGTAIAQVVNAFGILVQWMKIRGIHYFSHLTEADLHNFIYDSSCGLDAVLKSQERLRLVLTARKRKKTTTRKLKQTAPALKFSDVLIEAGIPSTQSPRLPAAKALFDSFIESGDIPPSRDLPTKQITVSVLWSRSNTFRLLWEYRDRVEDGLSFEPNSGDLAKDIKQFGCPTGSTRTLPVDYTCNLVGTAFTWLYDYAPLLVEFQHKASLLPSERYSRQAQLQKLLSDFNSQSNSNSWPIQLQTTRSAPKLNHFSWKMASRTLLPIACFTICGIFSARRCTELESLQIDDLGGSEKTGYWISSYIAKRATYEALPCTRSVADSIRILEALMDAQGMKKEQPIFNVVNGRGRLGNRLRDRLKRFGKLVSSTEVEQWQLAPHQFRRMFALIYRWRYDHPALIALSVYFGHVNLKHIKAYTNSKDWKLDNLEASRQFTLEKMRDIALGKVKPKGIFGKSLERAISRAIGQVELIDGSEQESVLTQLIEHRQLDLRPTQWGYCGAKSAHSNLRRAACTTGEETRSKATVEPEKSAEETCAGCLFFATDSSRQVHWLSKYERLRMAADSAPAGSMAQKKMLERQQVIERFARNNFKGSPQ